jgi:glycosyltransferase involved in cell wall biosynthesis
MPSPPAAAPRPVICHVIETLLHGGGEAAIHSLALGSRAAGYDVVICCFRPGPLLQRLERDGIAVEVLNLQRPSVLSGPSFVLYMWRALVGLRRVTTGHQVTLIHAHLPDSILLATVVGALQRVPVVGTYHGPGIMPNDRRRVDFRNQLRRIAYRWAQRRCRRTIAVSQMTRELLCGEYGFRPETTIFIPNGIDTALFARHAGSETLRATLGLERRRVVTCVGRLIPGKGQRYLIEAMVEIGSKHPDVHLLLVGDGPDRAALDELARERRVNDRVHLLGDRKDVPALLGLSDVFALPTFSEGFPISVLEAMAAATPVVVTAIPGNIEVVGDERHGKVVPVGDPMALAKAIEALLANAAAAREMGRRGQARVRQHFDLADTAARTIAVYEEVFGEMGQLRSTAA